MLNKLTIENFQIHRDTCLEFVPGVNVIAGESDAGKSAIFRSLVWVLTNKPQGVKFRSWPCEEGDIVSVSLELEDGHVITRNRSEKINEYMLDEQKFVAMKSDVPIDIAHLLAMTPVNIHTQYESHYLLSASSGEVARALNEACDLSVIDHTTKAVNTIITEAKIKAGMAETALVEQEEKLLSLSWVPDARKEFDIINEGWERLREREAAHEALYGIIVQLDLCECDLLALDRFAGVYSDIPSLEKLVIDTHEMTEKVKKGQTLIQDIARLDEKYTQLGTIPSQTEIDSVCELAMELRRVCEQEKGLRTLIRGIEKIGTEIVALGTDMQCLDNELKTLWDSVSICPLCEQQI